LCILTDRDQPSALEDLQVLRDRGLTDGERFPELRHRCLAAREASQDGAARRISEREECGVEAI
jgi:hypothetical protein